MFVYCYRDHAFDRLQRRSRKPKRKKAEVSGIDMPAKGTKPIRQYHKRDDSKILPSVKMGIKM